MRPNHLLNWTAMKYYCGEGARRFDFGRSTIDSSQYEFKKQWGAQAVPLYYEYWIKPGRELNILSPDSSKYAWKIGLWKRMPLWSTRVFGPFIGRWLA